MDTLAQAINAYQFNPDAYKDMSEERLRIMGLNPEMNKGKDSIKIASGYVVRGTNDPNYLVDSFYLSNSRKESMSDLERNMIKNLVKPPPQQKLKELVESAEATITSEISIPDVSEP